jgi:hypothetical protein
MSVPGNEVSACGADMPGPPTANELLAQGFIDAALAEGLSHRLNATHNEGIVLCDMDFRHYVKSESGPYVATFFHKDDVGWLWFTLSGHTPPNRQRAGSSGEDPYYLFGLGVRPPGVAAPLPATLTFASGSTLEVWFPFVLQKDRNYTLHLNDVFPESSALSGTLKNNVLRFVLPRFTLRTNAIADGEIDGASQ